MYMLGVGKELKVKIIYTKNKSVKDKYIKTYFRKCKPSDFSDNGVNLSED